MKYILGSRTVAKALTMIDQRSVGFRRHLDLLGDDYRGEVYCFSAGAKLYRLGSYLWGIAGYSYDGRDVKRAEDAFRRALVALR